MDAYINVANSAGVQVDNNVATAVVAALNRDSYVEPPQADDFETLLVVIAQATQVIGHLDAFREFAIAKADASGPTADRRKIGIAAAMPPSRLYRILDRHGRPRKRDYSSHDEPTQRMLASLVKGHVIEGRYRDESFAGTYISQNTDDDGVVWLLLTDHSTQEPIVVPATAVSTYH